MALWNDKRTPRGVITDSSSGRSGTLPRSIRPQPAPAARPNPARQRSSADLQRDVSALSLNSQADLDAHNARYAAVDAAKAKTDASRPKTAAERRQVAPRSKPVGKVPVDKPTNAAAAAGAHRDKRNVKGSAASGKPAPRQVR